MKEDFQTEAHPAIVVMVVVVAHLELEDERYRARREEEEATREEAEAETPRVILHRLLATKTIPEDVGLHHEVLLIEMMMVEGRSQGGDRMEIAFFSNVLSFKNTKRKKKKKKDSWSCGLQVHKIHK
jgi:hypothetical protein